MQMPWMTGPILIPTGQALYHNFMAYQALSLGMNKAIGMGIQGYCSQTSMSASH